MKMEYEIVIIGAGPAGLAAALAAAKSGKTIVIIDNNPAMGGQIWREGPIFPVPKLAQSLQQQILECSNIKLISQAKVVAAPQVGQLLVENVEHSFILNYQKLILCTGAREIFLPFPGWTLLGVTGAGGLQALIKAGTPVKNEKIVIAGTGPLLLASADTARKVGADVRYIAEQSKGAVVFQFARQLWQWPVKLIQALLLPHHLYKTDSYIIEAYGRNKLEGVKVQTSKGVVDIPCDRLACGFGLTPNTQLAQLLGCDIQEQKIIVDDFQQSSQEHILAAGECTGFGGSELALFEGEIAGFVATGEIEKARSLFKKRKYYQNFANILNRSFQLRAELKTLAKPDTIFCRCEDVTYEKVAVRCNWVDAKLHTRCGMGACQGSTCSTSAKFLFNWQISNSRPPLLPTRAKSLISLQSSSFNQS
jgi:D-hydroxyproline dehydrogenase subunit alpha